MYFLLEKAVAERIIFQDHIDMFQKAQHSALDKGSDKIFCTVIITIFRRPHPNNQSCTIPQMYTINCTFCVEFTA